MSTLSTILQRALAGQGDAPGILSAAEARAIRDHLTRTPDRPADLRLLVDTLQAALQAGRLQLSPAARRQRLHDLLADLSAAGGLPLPAPAADEDWVDVLLRPPPLPAPSPSPAAAGPPLPLGAGLALRPDGVLLRDGVPTTWHAEVEALSAALWALRAAPVAPAPGLTAALGEGLLRLEVPGQGDGKIDAAILAALAAEVLAQAPPAGALRDRLLRRGLGQPVLVALLRRALQAPLDAEALALLGAVERAAWSWAPWPGAWPLLGGLVFCRTAAGVESFLSTWPLLGTPHPEEREALLAALRAYLEGSPTEAFLFGQWKARAEEALGQARSARVTAGLRAQLLASPPRLVGRTLTATQATWLLGRLERVRDEAAAARFLAGLQQAADLLPVAAGAGLGGTGFALFQRVHESLAQQQSGFLGYEGLAGALSAGLGELAPPLRALRAALLSSQPDWRGLPLALPLARWLAEEILPHRIRGPRSLDSLGEALRVWQDAAPEGASFQAFLEDYLASWPGLQVFDFNKLGRMVSAHLAGAGGMLCRINGQPVEPGSFHSAVGEAVKAGLQHVAFPLPWLPHRWGYRAKQAVELVDLLAEQAWRGQGPLHTLHQQAAAGEQVVVAATTSDMVYNGLVFGVRASDGARTRWLYLDSTGDLHPHSRAPEPGHVLFEAAVDAQGRLDVRVAERLPLSPRAYPLMVPYGVGRRIDVEVFDAGGADVQIVQQAFAARDRVVQGTIVGYDALGRHRVRFLDAAGQEVEQTLTTQQIREANNPHLVPEVGGDACSVSFDRAKDTAFAADLVVMEGLAQAAGLLDFPLSLPEAELAQRQKAFLGALSRHSSATMLYPREPPVDDADRAYWARLNVGTHPCGAFLAVRRGVCRHQFIREHMGKQRGGIDERFASGAANTAAGVFRGLHIWGEVTLADAARLGAENAEPRDPRYLSDPTWADPYVPLWSGAYGADQRRQEMYRRTDRYSRLVVTTDG